MKKLTVTTLAFLLWSSVSFAAETHYQLQVNGLVCPFCEFNVEKKLSKIDGVLQVKANLKAGVVNVLVADGKTLPEDVVRQKITDAGFTLKSIDIHKPGKKQ
ncbi:heavy-metal-associated domain-containing protein [Dasania marina]|uniref:heavy-metal-associated domain-containing protein n=1 Tax=Dasania marina TaxID=471499 RepID=UPI0030D7171B|tara:strand:- start:7593 stop:7898 length:306 start_codon:yes stop_codon:yes gene_type:complete